MVNTIRTLIVDDQETMRIFMTRVLNSLGYDCETANNGSECLHLCSKNHYDVIFLDLVMPVLDGELCLSEVKLNYPNTDVVIMSVNDDEDSVSALLHSGATAYLCKPFTLETVQEVMGQLEENRKNTT